jgi:hypothetical protein
MPNNTRLMHTTGCDDDTAMEKVVETIEEFVAKYSEDQPRDEAGRFASDQGISPKDATPFKERIADAKKYGFTRENEVHGIGTQASLTNPKTGVTVTLYPTAKYVSIDPDIHSEHWIAQKEGEGKIGEGNSHASFIAWAKLQKK